MKIEKYVMPCRVVVAENTEDADNLLIKSSMQAGFKSVNCTKIKQGGYVLLDFGVELCGGVAVTVHSTSVKYPDYAKCRIVFGESVMEALSTINVKNATNDHAVRDEILTVSELSTLYFGRTGFRFVKLEAVHGDITVKTVRAETDIKDIEYKGSFRSSDELLNKIWQTGAYTVHLNMHDYVWDGVKRDRLVWIGDTNPEIATIKSVFGYDESVPNSLDFVKEENLPSEWMVYPSYSMWWIIDHYEWYMQNGDLDYLMEQTEYIKLLSENIIKWIRSEDKPDWSVFVDWSSMSAPKEALIGVYAVAYKAMDVASRILSIAKNTEAAQKCIECMEYIKSLDITVPNQKQIAGLCAYSGLCDAKKINDEILSKSPLDGISAFIGYYVLLARADAGDYEGALGMIRKYWGAMIKLGATTFWEEFDLGWVANAARIDEVVTDGMKDIHGDCGNYCYTKYRHSLCHGWASGPTAFLSQKLGGIEILEPGCRKVRVNPVLADLDWMEITYPTPFGGIKISAAKKDGKTEFEVSAPKEIEIVYC